MATFEATRSPKCCPWTNQGYLTFPHTPRRPRPDPREAYTRAYPNRVGPVDLTLAGPPRKEPTHKWWPQANLLVQTVCLVEGVVSYYILTSKTTGAKGKCGWFAFATMPLSKIVYS